MIQTRSSLANTRSKRKAPSSSLPVKTSQKKLKTKASHKKLDNKDDEPENAEQKAVVHNADLAALAALQEDLSTKTNQVNALTSDLETEQAEHKATKEETTDVKTQLEASKQETTDVKTQLEASQQVAMELEAKVEASKQETADLKAQLAASTASETAALKAHAKLLEDQISKIDKEDDGDLTEDYEEEEEVKEVQVVKVHQPAPVSGELAADYPYGNAYPGLKGYGVGPGAALNLQLASGALFTLQQKQDKLNLCQFQRLKWSKDSDEELCAKTLQLCNWTDGTATLENWTLVLEDISNSPWLESKFRKTITSFFTDNKTGKLVAPALRGKVFGLIDRVVGKHKALKAAKNKAESGKSGKDLKESDASEAEEDEDEEMGGGFGE